MNTRITLTNPGTALRDVEPVLDHGWLNVSYVYVILQDECGHHKQSVMDH